MVFRFMKRHKYLIGFVLFSPFKPVHLKVLLNRSQIDPIFSLQNLHKFTATPTVQLELFQSNVQPPRDLGNSQYDKVNLINKLIDFHH